MHTDRKGHRFAAREIVPEASLSVALMARSVGSEQPEYFTLAAAVDAGLTARPLPPGILGFFLTLEESDLADVLGVTYGRTLAASIESEAGVVATEVDVLVGESWVDEAWEKVGRDGTSRQFLVLATEFRLQATSELVSSTRITFVERVA